MKSLNLIIIVFMATGCITNRRVPINISFDNSFRQVKINFRGETERTYNLPSKNTLSICIQQNNINRENIVIASNNATEYWNYYLRELNSPVFEVNSHSSGNLFCDINIVTGNNIARELTSAELAWNRRTGVIIGGTITIEERFSGRIKNITRELTHQLGHFLGLSDDPGANMCIHGSVMQRPVPIHYFPTNNDINNIVDQLQVTE